jgi:hypothetical protein
VNALFSALPKGVDHTSMRYNAEPGTVLVKNFLLRVNGSMMMR